jgi:hypothetical protein
MRLYISAGKVIVDAEREAALQVFAPGMKLPPVQQRTVDTMLRWFDTAIAQLDPEDENHALRYIGLVLDKQYLRMVETGLIPLEGGDTNTPSPT